MKMRAYFYSAVPMKPAAAFAGAGTLVSMSHSQRVWRKRIMKRSASAVWTGDLKSGKGSMRLGSGAFEGAYSFASRFENGTGTNRSPYFGDSAMRAAR